MKKYIVNIYTSEKMATIEMKFGDNYIAKVVYFKLFAHFPLFTLLKLAFVLKWNEVVKGYKATLKSVRA